MDLKMKAETITAGEDPVWDVKVKNGIVPIITGDEADMQTATLAAFLVKGTIPQLPEVGVPWTGYLNGEVTFGELDAQVRQAIEEAGVGSYYPQYEMSDDQMTMTVGRKLEDSNGL